jgi:hypothetical protein
MSTDHETIVTGYIDVTPTFNYHREYEIVKRFIERLSANRSKLADDQVRYIEANLDAVRVAMQSIITDDIERQIRLTKDFPLHQQLFLHPFKGDSDVCQEPDCYAGRLATIHTL